MSGPRGTTCQAMGESNIELKWGSHVTHGIMPLEGNLKWLDKRIKGKSSQPIGNGHVLMRGQFS